MNKNMELKQAKGMCHCGACDDCLAGAEHVRMMDEAIADGVANGTMCSVCLEPHVLTQRACYDCCRLCTASGCGEPRHPNSLLCDKCLAKTIKPVSNVAVKHVYEPSWYGAYANFDGHQQINLMSRRQAKMLHLRHACHYDCGYCYEEAMEWLRKDCINRNVCFDCQEGLEEATEEVALKANTHGMEALTEYEQCFLEGSGKGRCPSCIENQQDMDDIVGITDKLNGNAEDAMARDTDSAGLCYGPKACSGRTFKVTESDCQQCHDTTQVSLLEDVLNGRR